MYRLNVIVKLIIVIIAILSFTYSCKKIEVESPLKSNKEIFITKKNIVNEKHQEIKEEIVDLKIFFFNGVAGTSAEFMGIKREGEKYSDVPFYKGGTIEFCQYDDIFDRIELYGTAKNISVTVVNTKSNVKSVEIIHELNNRSTIVREQLPVLSENRNFSEDVSYKLYVELNGKLIFQGNLIQIAVCNDL